MSRENNKLFNNTEKDPTDSGMLDQIKVVIFGDRFSLLTFTEGDSAEDQELSFNVKNGKIYSNGQELATGKNIIGTKGRIFLSVIYRLRLRTLSSQKRKSQISKFNQIPMSYFPTVKCTSIQMAMFST